MPAAPTKPLTRARAWTCLSVNQLATPGLGSLMGGKFFSGMGQLLLAVAGFLLILGWMWEFFSHAMSHIYGDEPPAADRGYGWLGKWGLIFFGASWAWAWFTSLRLLREASPDAAPGPKEIPPRISGPPA